MTKGHTLRSGHLWLLCFCFASFLRMTAQTHQLRNDHVVAAFGARGLVKIQNLPSGAVTRFAADEWSAAIDNDELKSEAITPRVQQENDHSLTYTYTTGGYTVRVIYEIAPDWKFVSKRVEVGSTPSEHYTVHSIEPLKLRLMQPPDAVITPGTYLPELGLDEQQSRALTGGSAYGAFLRFPNHEGLMLAVQNPFLHLVHEQNTVGMSYEPEMQWQQGWGSFVADTACIGPYQQTGRRVPSQLIMEWRQPPQPTLAADGLDHGEVEAFRATVEKFLVRPEQKPISVEVGWTLNDYQIDVGTAAGRAEYKRIIDATAQLGIDTLLYAPANSSLAQSRNDADSWHWEHTLWLNMGQQIREGKWDPQSGTLPSSEQEMLDYARSKHVGLLAYVYPSVPFTGNPSWIVAGEGQQKGSEFATLASRPFQDMLIRYLVAFKRRTGIKGYSFDYTYLHLSGSTAYAQWWGWRRVMEALRRAEPDIVIDGRQTYQEYGPWTWLAGSYPHPTGQDEQPESFKPFPDLHFDRVSADRARFVNYWYRNYQFAPEQIMPGYAFHQTERYVEKPESSTEQQYGELAYGTYRVRDWDQLGFRYSLLSSIATAGWNNVINMIPARDEAEARAFRLQDQQWIRDWLQWADEHKEYLLHTRTILGQPAIGKVDGTSAIVGSRGFVFLFNPNYKRMTAELPLDNSIGLEAGTGSYTIEEVYPRRGNLIGKPDAGVWKLGDRLTVPMDGTSAMVLDLEPAARQEGFRVFNAGPAATASIAGNALRIEHASGKPGTDAVLGVILPKGKSISHLQVNGVEIPCSQTAGYLAGRVHFRGAAFSQAEEVSLSPNDRHEVWSGSFLVPERIFSQLAARKTSWPIPWNKADYATTWLVPERLLIFVQFAEPQQTEGMHLRIDEKDVPLLRAYSSVRVHPASFVGWYADLSSITPNAEHKVELAMPAGAANRFQGLFFDNVEPEWTEEIKR